MRLNLHPLHREFAVEIGGGAALRDNPLVRHRATPFDAALEGDAPIMA